MAETIVENQICNACGADVRTDALFCYNCGGAVATEPVAGDDDKKGKVSDVWLRENIVENGKNDSIPDKQKNDSEDSVTSESIFEKPDKKPDMQTEAKLKSAASLRKKSATYQKKQIEVVWEEYENAPNGWFIAVALILTLFAIGVLFLAIYLK